jgi:hypothetical protein
MRGRRAFLCGAAVARSGGILALYAAAMAKTLSVEEVSRCGRFAAMELAMNARYAVAGADSALANQLVEATLYGSEADVVGVVIRDLKGRVLAQVGRKGKPFLSCPAQASMRDRRRTLLRQGARISSFFRRPCRT